LDSERINNLLLSTNATPNFNTNRETKLLTEETVNQRRIRLDRFLASIQGSGYRMAQLATSNKDDALELVQETMLQLVKRYAELPNNELKILFYKILNSRITDWYRKTAFRRQFHKVFSSKSYEQNNPIEHLSNEQQQTEDERLTTSEELEQLIIALASLSNRQKQVFLLRAWQGFNVKETASIVGCSAGSVKTHYSRAIKALKRTLTKYLPESEVRN